MIISPPFLPDGDVTQSQSSDDFVDGLMMKTGEGNFPISYYLQWHGGIHLKAPSSKSLVRAIADGKVLYVRQPTAKPEDYPTLEKHPLYNDLDGWTDNGCVVIQHDTEIGEDLSVTFYSIYMHLGSIEATVKQGADIHRKEKLGKAGIISDQEDQIHFEIVADEANTKKFIGDLAFTAPNYHISKESAEKAFQAQNGRTDACFGSMYFFVPRGASICEHSIIEEDKVVPVKNKRTGVVSNKTIKVKKNVYLPKKQDNGTDFTIGQDLYVEMAFDKGKCTFTSYDMDGQPLVGDPVVTQGDSSYTDAVHEYNLYKASLALYPSKPTAGFELLRFGRVIGDEDFEAPTTITHFREIQTAKGKYWVDLNKPYIKKYSDADLPYWKGWGVVSDDTDGDGRCDSTIVTSILAKKWTELSQGGSLNHIDSNQRAKDEWYVLTNDATIKEKLKRIFYKFPTEWSMTDFDTRYAWVKQDIYENAEKPFEKFKNFAQALAFWDEAGIPIDKTHWHFPPIEFIKHFRKCSWLSNNELTQILPTKIDGKIYIDQSNMIRNDVIKNNINKVFRKYCVTTPLRIASFLANAFEESAWVTTFSEGIIYRSRPWETKWYPPWNGRGFIQLTHPYNYSGYWEFRGRNISQKFKDFVKTYQYIEKHYHTKVVDPDFAPHKTDNRRFHNAPIQDDYVDATQHINNAVDLKQYQTWRDDLARQALKDPIDSAGFYWVLNNISKYADESHSLTINSGTQIYYTSKACKDVASVVNAGSVSQHPENSVNGFIKRCYAYGYALSVLTEKKFPNSNGILLEIPEGYRQRGIHGENLPNSTPKAKSHKKK
ncbi:M23 family metallopeptidase [Commensalibacter nepenthis]|uniref:M23 family metallopeptidase n=1 Tax=Commensalibacter nepenthis TaxID=3043872 RepID=A0ABT6QAI9_9PROT|nr:M23 family metallopeptidase [Commensalibacter sp. TBRC 10068]MDI2113923.1 M23 family metallopeptidase [Commensalibacter sp. TBRC 10068]